MISLSGEPSLGSLSLTRGGVRKYTYVLPTGMTFPTGAFGTIVFTDRAGGEYEGSPIDGEVSADSRSMVWMIEPEGVSDIPAGANFEVFVSLNDGYDYKVRYGRVVRQEVGYPLNPLMAVPPPLMFEDTLQRDQVGNQWIAKHGKLAMHEPAGAVDYAMAARNNGLFGAAALFSTASTLWYAPTQSDTIEMNVGLCDGGDGITTIVLASDYAMKSFLGVRFTDAGLGSTDRIQIVTGTGWNSLTSQGGSYDHIVPDDGNIYTIRYSLPTNTVSVWTAAGTDPVLEWTDTQGVVRHGPGYRYSGAIYDASLISTGPQLYYWKLKDAV